MIELFLIHCLISFEFPSLHKILIYTFLIKLYSIGILNSKSLYQRMKNPICPYNLYQNLLMTVNLLDQVLKRMYQDLHLTLILLNALIVYVLQDLSSKQVTAKSFVSICLKDELCPGPFKLFRFLFSTIPIFSFNFFVYNNRISKWLCGKRFLISYDFAIYL